MKTIVFDKEINHETIALLFNEIETIPETEQPTDYGSGDGKGPFFYERTIYFSSDGGYVSAADVLVDYLNTNPGGFLITLVGAGPLCSAAFDIFFKANPADKYLLKSAYGMAHEGTFFSNVRSEKDYDSFDNFYKQELQKQDVEMYNYYEEVLGIPKSRITKMKKGKDLYFSYDEMQKMLIRQWGFVVAEREALAKDSEEVFKSQAQAQATVLNESC